MPKELAPLNRIAQRIVVVRDSRVILSHDLAELYGVPTRALVQAVKRNLDRFPNDFMFRLTPPEATVLRSQIVISKIEGRGGSRYAPLAFTEQGVAMLSSVLKSSRAVAVNIEIMRTFVRLRQLIAAKKDLTHRIASLETRFDGHARTVNGQLRTVFEALQGLMAPPVERRKRPIGFNAARSLRQGPRS